MNLTTTVRSKAYWIAGFLSLMLFFLAVSEIAYVVTESADFLGLVSHLPAPYWAGFGLLVVCAALVFLDEEPKSDALHLFLLVLLGLYIFGIATLVEENARHATVYHNISDVRNVLATGHSDINAPWAMEYYRMWPAVHFVSASTLLIAGIDLEPLVQYAPWFWLACYISFTYAVGKRLGLPQKTCFALSFLALSSYWMLQSDASQQAIAGLLFLLLFALMVKPVPQYSAAETIIIVLLFSALVIMHGLTALTVLPVLVGVTLYRWVRHQTVRFVPLLPMIWMLWYIYQATTVVRFGKRYWLAAPWDYILRMGMNVEGIYQPPVSGISAVTSVLTHYSQIGYALLFGAVSIAAIIYLLRGKVESGNRQWAIVILTWLIAAVFVGFIFPTKELWARFLILGLVPVICFIVKVLPSPRLMVALGVVCLILILPARYGTEATNPFAQVHSTELAGSRFVGYYRAPGKPWLKPWIVHRSGDVGVLHFYDADIHVWVKRAAPSPEAAGFDEVLNGASYVINSKYGGASDLVIARWMETEGGQSAALLYDNGAYRVYMSHGGLEDVPLVE